MHRRIYPFRIVGMGLGSLPVGVVLHMREASPLVWAFVLSGALLWPHLAYLLARRSADPYRAEIRNLLVDSMIAGAWVPLMYFNLLPSIVLLTLSSVDKISTGVRGLWLRSLPGMLLAILVASLVTDAAFSPTTSMQVILACLPVMLIHTISVSLGSYRLIRKVSQQNRELDRLHRTDALTGLSARADWEQHADEVLQARNSDGQEACLLLIDIDEFKHVNDRHGHAAGDAVLRAMATRMRTILRPQDRAGRIGGDEFVVLLPGTDLSQAAHVAERLRAAIATLRLRDYPDVHPTISIGLAAAGTATTSLRAWMSAADDALYRAKDAGRNRVML